MTAFTTRVRYATFSERPECELIAPGVVELTEFSDFLPLGPGDRVVVDGDGINDVVAGADGVDQVRFVRSPGETLDLAALIEAENADQQDDQ